MSLINTRMQNMRSGSNLDKNEIRPSRYGALDMFMMQSNQPGGILTDELKEKAEISIGNTLQTPVINYDGTISIGNTRSVTIADSENTSAMYTISFATYSWGFTIVPAMYSNNEIKIQKDFEAKFNKYLYLFGATMDNACIAALEAAKSQVFADSLNYTVTANTLAAAWSQRENIIGDINPIMAANDHFMPIHILGNGGVESAIRKMTEKDLYNEVNKTLEYSDKTLHFSSRIANAADIFSTMYAVQMGSLGILPRFERESLLNTVSRTGHEWGIDTLPMLDFPVGTYYYESVGDFSAIAGAATADLTRARKEHYGFAVDVAVLTPYNSDLSTIANPIVKATVADEAVSDALKVQITNESTNPVYTQEVP